MSDLTVIYITANMLPDTFFRRMRAQFLKAIGDTPYIVVTKKGQKDNFTASKEIVRDTPRSHIDIYKDALAGVKEAETKYIAIAEDDVLYSPEHFRKRPTSDDIFAYNIACWSIYTWSKPAIFSYTGRRNHGMLICSRDLYIKALEERFAKFPDDSKINNAVWAEPGKYEANLGVTVQKCEIFYTDPANVMFTHPQGLSFHTLGTKKRLAPIRALEIPHWGKAENVITMYE